MEGAGGAGGGGGGGGGVHIPWHRLAVQQAPQQAPNITQLANRGVSFHPTVESQQQQKSILKSSRTTLFREGTYEPIFTCTDEPEAQIATNTGYLHWSRLGRRVTLDGVLLVKRSTEREKGVLDFCVSLPPGLEPTPDPKADPDGVTHVVTGHVVELPSLSAVKGGHTAGVGSFQMIPHPVRSGEECMLRIHIRLQPWSQSEEGYQSADNPQPSILAVNQTSKVALSLTYLLDALP